MDFDSSSAIISSAGSTNGDDTTVDRVKSNNGTKFVEVDYSYLCEDVHVVNDGEAGIKGIEDYHRNIDGTIPEDESILYVSFGTGIGGGYSSEAGHSEGMSSEIAHFQVDNPFGEGHYDWEHISGGRAVPAQTEFGSVEELYEGVRNGDAEAEEVVEALSEVGCEALEGLIDTYDLDVDNIELEGFGGSEFNPLLDRISESYDSEGDIIYSDVDRPEIYGAWIMWKESVDM